MYGYALGRAESDGDATARLTTLNLFPTTGGDTSAAAPVSSDEIRQMLRGVRGEGELTRLRLFEMSQKLLSRLDGQANSDHKGQIKRETPYSNLAYIRKILRDCKDYIWWLDKHFDPRAFELLADEVDRGLVKEIRVLSTAEHLKGRLSNFRRFRHEMVQGGIGVEWRVGDLDGLHDRYLISQEVCYNIPPVNTIYKGDLSDIQAAVERPDFDRWWRKATPVT
jgi:hypothetical protein